MAEKGKAVYRIVINGSQERSSGELSSTDRPLGAILKLAHAHHGAEAGGRMQMRTVSGGHVVVDGDVVEYDPPHRFVHTHRFTSHDDPVCKVTYELKPVTGGIEVTLTVDDLPLGTQTAKEMQRGGMFILNNLKAIVESGRPPLGRASCTRCSAPWSSCCPSVRRPKTGHWRDANEDRHAARPGCRLRGNCTPIQAAPAEERRVLKESRGEGSGRLRLEGLDHLRGIVSSSRRRPWSMQAPTAPSTST